MKLSTVRLYHPPYRNCWIDESPINEWLVANIGIGESFRNSVHKQHRWYVDHKKDCLIYYFVCEKDAMRFALRWV